MSQQLIFALFVLAVFVGLIVLSLVIAYVYWWRKGQPRTAKTPTIVQQSSQLITLAVLPFLDEKSRDFRLERGPFAEALSSLTLGVQFAFVENSERKLLVSSTHQGDGKSFVAANLAASLAKSGHHVLLIDANLDRPVLHHSFQLTNHQGLTNVLARLSDADAVPITALSTFAQPTFTAGLTVLTSGPVPGNAFFLLDSTSMSLLMSAILAHYDYVIVDGPAALRNDHASILVGQVQQILFVIDSAQTDEGGIRKALRQVNRAGGVILGSVLNRSRSARNQPLPPRPEPAPIPQPEPVRPPEPTPALSNNGSPGLNHETVPAAGALEETIATSSASVSTTAPLETLPVAEEAPPAPPAGDDGLDEDWHQASLTVLQRQLQYAQERMDAQQVILAELDALYHEQFTLRREWEEKAFNRDERVAEIKEQLMHLRQALAVTREDALIKHTDLHRQMATVQKELAERQAALDEMRQQEVIRAEHLAALQAQLRNKEALWEEKLEKSYRQLDQAHTLLNRCRKNGAAQAEQLNTLQRMLDDRQAQLEAARLARQRHFDNSTALQQQVREMEAQLKNTQQKMTNISQGLYRRFQTGELVERHHTRPETSP